MTLIYVTDLTFIELRMKPSVPQQVWRHRQNASLPYPRAAIFILSGCRNFT